MDSTKTLDDSNIFVKFLPPSVDDVELKRLFRPFGGIVSAKVMLDPHTWKSLGYGFVKFNTKEEANLAIEKMSGHRMGNKVLLCKISNHSNFSDPSPNVYIKPLPFSFSEEKMTEIFGEFGEVTSAKIVRSPDNTTDVVGLVRYPFYKLLIILHHLLDFWLLVPFKNCLNTRKH
eukprot:Phypoly_transcript_10712.p1 GENE.Phypoly_transcript_10712~~Phypoly_transcript_10712.p1  ORF type:complete len:174 (+),score=27.33 Phypoly_transcript_10712:215-736(+)